MTKSRIVLALATVLVALRAREGAATCDPTGADASDVANARATVATRTATVPSDLTART